MLGSEVAQSCLTLCDPMDCRPPGSSVHGIFQARSWLLMIKQTEQLSRIMKTHAEDLNSGPLHRLTMMIKDKQQVKKSYIGVHQQIEAEMIKVTKTELEKLKTSYRQLIKEMNSAKEKYKEAVAKGMAQKGIFDEYSQITSLVTEEIVNVHKEIQMSVEQIDPSTEYNNFIDVHRLRTLAEELMQTQQMLLNKEEAVLELEKRIEESSKSYERKSDIVLLLSQKQALEELKQSVQQLRCTEAKFTAQKELLEQKVQENDGKEPPPVVNYEEDARSVTSMKSCPTVCDPGDRGPPGSSVLGILRARTLERVARPSSRGSAQPRDRTLVSCFAVTRESDPLMLSFSPNHKESDMTEQLTHRDITQLFSITRGHRRLINKLCIILEDAKCQGIKTKQDICIKWCLKVFDHRRSPSERRTLLNFLCRMHKRRPVAQNALSLEMLVSSSLSPSSECPEGTTRLLHIGHLLTWGVPLSVSYHFAFSYLVCHSLLQWTTFYIAANYFRQWERQREGSDAGAFFLRCWNTKEGSVPGTE
ncbi:hypothetical protein FD755_002085 [Muntiacus reevesi]|uniref:F-BAR domain-containing protein n=1 Tax=Muntiacus reevesi TaxID=9886 RepID=A0A5J5N691_MUNRE|nr:hypothetical protein FD755_002085 [Muntiacus reevesi]